MSARLGVLSSLGSVLTVPVLDSMAAEGAEVVAVILDGRLSARDREICAARLDRSFDLEDLDDRDLGGVPSYFQRHDSDGCVELVRSLELDYLVNAGTPRVLPEPVLHTTRGVINCHPGILPAYRGCTAVEWSIYYGDPVGATAHFMSTDIDEGPILLTAVMKVNRHDPYELVRTRMIFHQAGLLARATVHAAGRGVSAGDLPPQGEGRYHGVIGREELMEAKARLARGEYESP